VQAVLRKYGILFLADEVVCGFGRTGHWFGSQALGIEPDMMAMAKGMSSSYFPISAVAVSRDIYSSVKSFNSAGTTFGHGFTNSGHPVGAAIVTEVLAIYHEMNVLDRVRVLGDRLLSRVVEVLADCDVVGNIRGQGLLVGVEIVEDQGSKTPFSADLGVPSAIERAAMQKGLILRPQGNTITFCPPFVVSEEQIDEMAGTLAVVLRHLRSTIHS
jgi:4-aminobutyrate--pyruvate transaminase